MLVEQRGNGLERMGLSCIQERGFAQGTREVGHFSQRARHRGYPTQSTLLKMKWHTILWMKRMLSGSRLTMTVALDRRNTS